MCGFLIYTHTERTSKRSHTHVDNHRIVNLFGFAVCLLYICYEINAKNTSQRKTHSLTGSQTHTPKEKERERKSERRTHRGRECSSSDCETSKRISYITEQTHIHSLGRWAQLFEFNFHSFELYSQVGAIKLQFESFCL